RIPGGMDNVGMSQLHEINPLTSQERALVTSWAAPPAWVPGRGKHLSKSGGQMELPVPGVTTKGKAAS
ncbi:MAG: hypothetical protein ACXVXY_13075, partial [Mycobacteriaceae bacterium]